MPTLFGSYFYEMSIIILSIFCKICLAHNEVRVLTSNMFNNIKDSIDADSIKLYLIILTSIGIMIFIILLIFCLLVYSKNIKSITKVDNNENKIENLIMHSIH